MPLRIIDTLIGAAIAWVAVSYLWPDWRYLTLERTAGRAIANDGAYLRVILDQLQNGSIDDIAYRSARRQTHRARRRAGRHLVRHEQRAEKNTPTASPTAFTCSNSTTP